MCIVLGGLSVYSTRRSAQGFAAGFPAGAFPHSLRRAASLADNAYPKSIRKRKAVVPSYVGNVLFPNIMVRKWKTLSNVEEALLRTILGITENVTGNAFHNDVAKRIKPIYAT